ncbi:MAG TPA: oligosaccharide flippase family protein [Blastocatellia bacterium]
MKAEAETESPARAADEVRPKARRIRVGETARQAGMLFSAHTLSTLLGLLVTIILGRWMEPEEMGRFQFCLSFIIISGLFFEAGIFSAGARLLALVQGESEERRAVGALLALTAMLSGAFALFLVAVAVPVELIFEKEVRWLFFAAAAFAFFYPFQQLIEHTCQGLNRIRLLSAFQILSAGAYLLILLGLALTNRLVAGSALVAYFGGLAVATAFVISRLKPDFSAVAKYVKLTLKEVRSYGLNLYVARVTGIITAKADHIAIAYYMPATAPLGIYSIAQKFTQPIVVLSRSVALSRFRAFSKLSKVPRAISGWNALLLLISGAGMVVLGPVAIELLFPKYVEAAPLLAPLAVMQIFVGLLQPYMYFLASHGRGAELRNTQLIVSSASVAGLLFSVPRFGILGAAWTGAAAMLLDYLLLLYYYSRFKPQLSKD